MTATADFTQATGNLPPNANKVGYEPDRTPLYLARASHEGGLHPGKYRADLAGSVDLLRRRRSLGARVRCIWTGHLSDRSSGTWIYWEDLNGWSPVECGHEADGTPLYAARAGQAGGEQIGKWRRGWTVASIPYGGAEVRSPRFEVLCPGTTID